MNFRTLSNRKTVDLVNYVKAYLNDNPDTELLVGCDSQNYAYNTTYATVVALYKPKGGAHVLFNKEVLPLERVRQVRLMNEVWKSVETAEILKNRGIKVEGIIFVGDENIATEKIILETTKLKSIARIPIVNEITIEFIKEQAAKINI